MSVLESPQYVGKSGPRTLFSIETKNGKLMRGHSYFEQEDEIILAPGRYFRVIDKLNPAPDLHIIHLREIASPYPMISDPFDLRELRNILPIAAQSPSVEATPKMTSHVGPVSFGTDPMASKDKDVTKPAVLLPAKKGKFIQPYRLTQTGESRANWYSVQKASFFSQFSNTDYAALDLSVATHESFFRFRGICRHCHLHGITILDGKT